MDICLKSERQFWISYFKKDLGVSPAEELLRGYPNPNGDLQPLESEANVGLFMCSAPGNQRSLSQRAIISFLLDIDTLCEDFFQN